MIHEHLTRGTYGTSAGLTLTGWLMQHLPSPDVTAQIASWVGILTGLGMFIVTVYFKWSNRKLYKEALKRGYMNGPSDKD